jgi:hypothetical protein
MTRFGSSCYLLVVLLSVVHQLIAVNAFLPSSAQLAKDNHFVLNAAKRKSKGPDDDESTTPSKGFSKGQNTKPQGAKSTTSTTTRSWDPMEIMKGHSSEARAVSEPRGATFYMADNYSPQSRRSGAEQAAATAAAAAVPSQSSSQNEPFTSFDPMSEKSSTDQFVKTIEATQKPIHSSPGEAPPKKSSAGVGAKPIASVGPNFDSQVHSSYAETASYSLSPVERGAGVASWQPDLKERVLKEVSGSFVRSVAVDSEKPAPSGRESSASQAKASSGERSKISSWDPLRQ